MAHEPSQVWKAVPLSKANGADVSSENDTVAMVMQFNSHVWVIEGCGCKLIKRIQSLVSWLGTYDSGKLLWLGNTWRTQTEDLGCKFSQQKVILWSIAFFLPGCVCGIILQVVGTRINELMSRRAQHQHVWIFGLFGCTRCLKKKDLFTATAWPIMAL